MLKKCYIENEGNATLSMDDIYYYSINNSLLFLANILFGNYRLPIKDTIFAAIQWTKRNALRWSQCLRFKLSKFFSYSGRWAEKMDTRLAKRFGIIGVGWHSNEK